MMDNGKQMVNDGKQIMNDGKQMMNDGKQMMDNGKQVMNDGKQMMGNGKQMMNDRKRMMNDGKQMMGNGIRRRLLCLPVFFLYAFLAFGAAAQNTAGRSAADRSAVGRNTADRSAADRSAADRDAVRQDAYAEPKRGEGISAFLERNGRPGKAYYDEFVKLNGKLLRGKEELRLGVKYVLPPLRKEDSASGTAAASGSSSGTASGSSSSASSGSSSSAASGSSSSAPSGTASDASASAATSASASSPSSVNKKSASDKKGTANNKKKLVRERLFGKELADVEVTSDRLKGACFYVVSGHGGPDPGAIGKIGRVELHEDEYAYDVALRLARNLMQEGAEVHIIIRDAKDGIRDARYLSNSKRETCMGDAIPLNQVARLQQRCDKINALYRKDRKRYNYCRAIFLHVDSRSKSAQTDVFFYHAPKSALGEKLAATMKSTFESKYDRHQPNRGFEGTVSPRRLYVLLQAAPVSVFVELGNIQNAFDQRRFVISSNRQALAKWMMEGFIADYKSSK